jgi:hypothetical protein
MRMRALGRLVRRLLPVVLVPTVLGGCLVASDPDFRGQDECVPFFLTHEADPSTSETHRRPESTSDPEEFRASVPMRSCALTTDYEARVFVDNKLVDISQIPPTGGELRDISVLVDIAGLTGCHTVELFISSNFADFKTPERSGDVAKVSWFVFNDPATPVPECGGTTP